MTKPVPVTPVTLEMAAIPMWFTKNKRVYHISSDTSTSLCTADNVPTNQNFEGKPLDRRTGRTTCQKCVDLYKTKLIADLAEITAELECEDSE